MWTIYKKEIRSFLSSLIAYVVIAVFLIVTGMFTWLFKDTSVLDSGYANLDPLFSIAPIIFIFLVSAITMRSFSEERKSGTIETLTTRPVSDMSIIMGKYFAGLTLVLFSILPTLLYYYSVNKLSINPEQTGIDKGATLGSYIGLLLLGAVYVAIGTFASALSDNQIIAFLLSMFLCFFFFIAFDFLSDLEFLKNSDFSTEWLGINYHYRSISKGVADTRDLIYFLSLTILFLGFTKFIFGSRKW
ncbi:MAG: gliding motility-associated ABC transporter permease subunit GldF [Bacteroidetes bacterium]|nr:gliding motility-associated ABC transporter permease subunit GldF [Bacteroidota bacterium]